MIINSLDIIENEHLLIAHCNLKIEFRYERYGLKQKFILCLESKYHVPSFVVKLSISTSYLMAQYEKESYGCSTSR
jgi:hypothetical protein